MYRPTDCISMKDFDVRDDLLWSVLLYDGYLKHHEEAERRNTYRLRIPNDEVKWKYEDLIPGNRGASWSSSGSRKSGKTVSRSGVLPLF